MPCRPALMLLCLLALWGCRPHEAPPPAHPASDAAQDSAFALLASVRFTPLRTAFGQLPDYHFTRHTRTVQLGPTHAPRASEERIVRHETQGGRRLLTVQEADTAGTFRNGFLYRLAAGSDPVHDPRDVIQHVLPDEPPYLSPRNRHAYTYEVAADTVLWNRPVQVIQIQARPEEGDGQHIRRVRLYVDRSTRDVLALSTAYVRPSLIFREHTTVYVSLRPAPDGAWVPYNTRVQARLQVPLRPARSFLTTSTYYDYAPAARRTSRP